MADKLSEATVGPGHNNPPYSRDQLLTWVDEYADADKAVADAVSARKDLRIKIKAGVGKEGLAAFDRHRKDAAKSGEVRVKETEHYNRMMAYRGMPLGHQFDIFGEGKPNGHAPTEDIGDEPPEHQRRRVEDHGFVSGKGGTLRSANPYNPGSLLHTTWDGGWMRGQETIAQEMAPSDKKSANGSATAETPKRRGRPPRAKGVEAAPPPADGQPGTRLLDE